MLIFCGFGLVVFLNEMAKFLRSVKFSVSWGRMENWGWFFWELKINKKTCL